MYRSIFVVPTLVSLAVLTVLAPSAYANQPPRAVASAGVDPVTGHVLNQVTLFVGPNDPGIPVTIAGGGSSDPDGDPLTYFWTCTDQATNGKCIFPVINVPANEVNYRPTLLPGTFDITLTVADGQGHTATDAVSVRVRVDTTPPTVTPPDDESVSATEAGGASGAASSDLHQFLFNSATATDNSTAIFTHLPPRVNGADVDDSTLFPHGTTTVTFRIADSFGNVGTATADVFVTDLQSGDLFVGVLAPNNQGLHKGLVQRIRGGVVTDFCQSPDDGSSRFNDIGDPDFWYQPNQVVVDSKGRVAFLAYLGGEGAPSPQSWGLARCNLPGQPAEKLAIFPQRSYIDPGWPVPLPGRMFPTPGLIPTLPLAGLHLRKVKNVLIDDNSNSGNPQIVTDERYVFAYNEDPNGGSIGNVSVNTESLDWKENDLSPVAVGFTTTGWQNMLPEMFFHSKTETVSFLGLASFSAPVAKTYVGRFGVLRRINQPFEVQLTANTSGGTVHLGVQAFGGFTELPNSPIMDDVTLPNFPSGCTAPPGGRGDWPIRAQPGGGSYTSLQTGGVIFERNSGLAVNAGGWFGHLDEALFDLDPQNDRQAYFARPETGCLATPVVNFTPLAGNGVLTSFQSQDGYHFDAMGRSLHPDRMAASPNGLFGTQDGSGNWSGRVVQAAGALDLTEVATGLNHPKGLGAFPPQVGNIQVSALIIRIDSPVDVVLSDDLGRRFGVMDGQDVNEFGSQAHDTGAQTHPRLYIIQHPQPGIYAVRSTGTDSGLFTVHIYSVDSEKHVTQHISHSGDAQPGSVGAHDFELNADARVSFANSTPVADAGFDQTANSDSSGKATFVLDGSQSSDPDGDTLTFTWAGPFGVLSGAPINATLGVGVHVLQLTVDDGKGGVANDSVIVTVVAVDNDGDGVLNGVDNCPDDANGNQLNSDGDAQGDVCDPDDDNDGELDANDAFPFNAAEQLDTDGDGIGNNGDADDDGDGASDLIETEAGSDPLNPASTPEICDGLDNDGDGTADDGLPNHDGDAFGDACDANNNDGPLGDLDGDGLANNVDPNDNDGPLGDLDSDGVLNGTDNCVTAANADQLDTDGDGQGNVCDDTNGSGSRIADLARRVSGLALNRGLINSLLAKLDAAARSFERGNRTAGQNQLRAFINELDALKRSRRLDAATADALIAEAAAIAAG